MAKDLDVLRRVDFDWTLHLDSVWVDSDYHVPALHQALRDELLQGLASTAQSASALSPLGRVIVGAAGSGKTHLLGALRQASVAQGHWFVLVDMTDVRDFWETVLLGYLSSLHQPLPDGTVQFRAVLERILANVLQVKDAPKMLRTAARVDADKLATFARAVVDKLKTRLSGEAFRIHQHQDVLRALMLLNSQDGLLNDTGYSWLTGLELEEATARQLRFGHLSRKPLDIVSGLSWLMSLGGATLLSLDQVDAIVSEHNLAAGERNEPETDEQRAALSIIEGLAGGLMALHNVTRRTLAVVSCLEASWETLKRRAVQSSTDRFVDPLALKFVGRAEVARDIVARRLAAAFHTADFVPPYPTWPYRPEAFQTVVDAYPRHILKVCDQHRRKCLAAGNVTELESFDQVERISAKLPVLGLIQIDRRFEALKLTVDPQVFVAEKNEDQALGALLQAACRCLVKEVDIPEDVDVFVDEEFPGAKSFQPLHARIRLVYRRDNDRERHFCFRGLQRSHPIAYQNRLKAAMTASGIDSALGFRHLVLVRRSKPPTGAVSQHLTAELTERGGILVNPSDDDLRTLGALRTLESERPEGFDDWLRSRRPASCTALMQTVQLAETPSRPPAIPQEAPPEPAPPEPAGSLEAPHAEVPKTPAGKHRPRGLAVGRRMQGTQLLETIAIPLQALTKHAVILAGAGSGKTVLVRRIVEEAALLGVPSIVIDAANDLARLGQRWPAGTHPWTPDHVRKADTYQRDVEVIVWTPGREKGNPLHLSPFPDFASVLDDADELQIAMEMAHQSLQTLIAGGASVRAQKKQGVLAAALKYFAQRRGATLGDFVDLLTDLPPQATGDIGDADKMAQEMADQLRAAMATNPLLREAGSALDPGHLLRASTPDKTRISVINFIGLPRLDAQQEFLNQLAMTLFSWVKKHPGPAEAPLQGLLVLDEAKDFIPSIQSVPCRSSLLRLSAQARKYGLGLVFATQAPRSIDHNVIANCSTQFFGRANSPAAISVVQGALRQRGATGDDIARLEAGVFYVWTEGMAAPAKVKTPLCLTYHPATPLDEAGVLAEAQASRERLQPSSR